MVFGVFLGIGLFNLVVFRVFLGIGLSESFVFLDGGDRVGGVFMGLICVFLDWREEKWNRKDLFSRKIEKW